MKCANGMCAAIRAMLAMLECAREEGGDRCSSECVSSRERIWRVA